MPGYLGAVLEAVAHGRADLLVVAEQSGGNDSSAHAGAHVPVGGEMAPRHRQRQGKISDAETSEDDLSLSINLRGSPSWNGGAPG